MLDLPARRTRRNGSARSDVNWGRLRRRCRPRVCLFEDRTLLSAPSANPLAAVAIPIALGTPKTGTLSANEVVFFQISPTTDGRLIAQVHAPGGTTSLTLMDSQGQVLLTSDGQSPTNQDDQIELYVSAGTDFLEVQNLGGSGTYSLTTSLTPSAPPLQPIPINPDGSGPSEPDQSWRATSPATAAPTSPSPTSKTTTCRSSWATATAPSRTRSLTRWGPIPSPS